MKNNLDRYFRDNLRDREFEFNDVWWQQAEQLLDANRRKRRAALAWQGAALLLLAAVLAGWWFLSENPTPVPIENSTQQADAKSPAGHGISKAFFQNDQNQASEKPESASTSEDQTKNAILNSKKADNPQESAALTGVSAQKKEQQQQVAPPYPTGLKKETSPPENPASNAGNPAAQTENKSHAIVPENFDSTPETARRTKDLTAIPMLASPVLGDFLKNLNLSSGDLNRSNFSRLAVGFTAAQLMQAGSASGEQLVIGHRAGLVLRYGFSKNWFVSSGLQYLRRGGTFEVSKAVESRRYRFGVEVDSQLLKPTSLHYASMPVMLGWQRGRHLLETGLQFEYLAGLRGSRGVFEKTTDLPPRRGFKTQQEGWLVEDGYKKITATVQLGYHYRVNRQLSFGASVNYTPGGILAKNYAPPTGRFLLKEADKFFITVQSVYFIK